MKMSTQEKSEGCSSTAIRENLQHVFVPQAVAEVMRPLRDEDGDGTPGGVLSGAGASSGRCAAADTEARGAAPAALGASTRTTFVTLCQFSQCVSKRA